MYIGSRSNRQSYGHRIYICISPSRKPAQFFTRRLPEYHSERSHIEIAGVLPGVATTLALSKSLQESKPLATAGGVRSSTDLNGDTRCGLAPMSCFPSVYGVSSSSSPSDPPGETYLIVFSHPKETTAWPRFLPVFCNPCSLILVAGKDSRGRITGDLPHPAKMMRVVLSSPTDGISNTITAVQPSFHWLSSFLSSLVRRPHAGCHHRGLLVPPWRLLNLPHGAGYTRTRAPHPCESALFSFFSSYHPGNTTVPAASEISYQVGWMRGLSCCFCSSYLSCGRDAYIYREGPTFFLFLYIRGTVARIRQYISAYGVLVS